MQNDHFLILMRGLPGSGKSFKAHNQLANNVIQNGHFKGHSKGEESSVSLVSPHVVILSSDDYFITDGAEYNFNQKLLGKAHEWNQKRARDAMAAQVATIIIDNTNVQLWEMKPYVEMAVQEFGYQVRIEEPESDWWRGRDLTKLAECNSHGVSMETICRMNDRWQDLAVDGQSFIDQILSAERPW